MDKNRPCRAERDFLANNPHQPGVKLDDGKTPIMRGVFEYFPRAIEAIAKVSAFGAKKYAWGGWRTVEDVQARYGDALARHLVAACREKNDQESNLPHLAHAAWCALACLELSIVEQAKNAPTSPPAKDDPNAVA
jgi:hypothetical protein